MPHRMRLGVCYYPEQWPPGQWADDARRMRELGLAVVRIAEFAWARIEPRAGVFDWDWLDRAVATLSGAGLEVVLGTPTAAPPAWLLAAHPDIAPVGADGRAKPFGARRHYCFSNPHFHAAAARVVEAMARRYGTQPAVVGWQVDNEYGCHDTVLSYSPAALLAFRAWLQARYGTLEALNGAWGTAFWSLRLERWEDVGFPVGQPTAPLPAHALDFRRFASDEVLRFHRLQVALLRVHAPGRPVLHNFMGLFGGFDHHALGTELDIAAWDNYPLGFVDSAPFVDDAAKRRWAHTGHPDISAFHHDLYRGTAGGRWWVMEQQAGPVNWAPWNARPAPGMVRAWTWEAFAHGAELVSYFRFRQLPYGQEQMHSGLHTPDGALDTGGREAAAVAAELAALGPPPAVARAPVALLFDYPSLWMSEIQPHGADMNPWAQALAWYGALRRLGLDVDVVAPSVPLAGYAMVVAPALLAPPDGFVSQLHAFDGVLVLGPRAGSRTAGFSIPATLPPGPLARVMPMRVVAAESLRPGLEPEVRSSVGESLGRGRQWRDIAEPAPPVDVLACYADGAPAWLRHGRCFAQTGIVDDTLQQRWLAEAGQAAGLALQPLEGGLRLRRRGAWRFAFNHGPDDAQVPAPPGTTYLLGGARLAPADVALWREETAR